MSRTCSTAYLPHATGDDRHEPEREPVGVADAVDRRVEVSADGSTGHPSGGAIAST